MQLEVVVQNYPYFQAAKALQLKGLYNQKSFRYNFELKKTAAITQDRSVLFEYITGDDFTKKELLVAGDGLDEETKKTSTENDIIIESKQEELPTLKDELGTPLPFSTSENRSFNEWLQLTKLKPIDRNQEESNIKLNKKLDLIDQFIAANPKIAPANNNTPTPANIAKSLEEPTTLMTETLARVYLEQKKYSRAIQAYEILILKYPEKSSFFANRIKEIKQLQQNN